MAYQANIPAATDQISQSQMDIQGNFQALNPVIQGVIDLPPQIGNPASTTHNIIYAKNYTNTSQQEVFIENAAGTTFTPITAARKAAIGWTYLPSGLLMAWGVIGGSGNVTLLYSTITNFPGFTMTPFSFQLTPYRTTATPSFLVYLDSFTPGANTNLQLGVFFSGAAANAFFLVMGI